VIEFEVDQEGVLGIVVVLLVDIVESGLDNADYVDWTAVDEEVVVVTLDEVVFAGTTALDFAQDVALEEGALDVDQTVADSVVELSDPFKPSSAGEDLVGSCLDDYLLLSLSVVDEDELDLRVDKAEFLDHFIGSFEELLILGLQLDMPHWEVLEDTVYRNLCPCIPRILLVGDLEVEFSVAESLLFEDLQIKTVHVEHSPEAIDGAFAFNCHPRTHPPN
jgi:hypothetical protein